MVRRNVVALVFVFSCASWSVDNAFAQSDAVEPVPGSLASAVASVEFANSEQSGSQVPRGVRRPAGSWSTPVLFAMHAATMTTQMLDVHSTVTALKLGATEANPIMSGLVNNRAAFIGVKAAMGAGLIMATHKMAQHNKVAAIVTAAAVNSVMLTVAHHNYKVARSFR